MSQTEHEKTEASIDQKTTISLWLVGTLVAGAIGVTLWQYKQRDEVLTEIRELRVEIGQANTKLDKRVTSVEDVTTSLRSSTWTTAMQEIWVLRSKEAGAMADPAPIIDRHGK